MWRVVHHSTRTNSYETYHCGYFFLARKKYRHKLLSPCDLIINFIVGFVIFAFVWASAGNSYVPDQWTPSLMRHHSYTLYTHVASEKRPNTGIPGRQNLGPNQNPSNTHQSVFVFFMYFLLLVFAVQVDGGGRWSFLSHFGMCLIYVLYILQWIKAAAVVMVVVLLYACKRRSWWKIVCTANAGRPGIPFQHRTATNARCTPYT